MDVARFDPHREDPVPVARVQVAAMEHARTPGPRPNVDTAVWRLRNPFPDLGPAVHWVARAGGEVVGVAVAYFPERENTSSVLLTITVHPDHRRRGAGAALLRAVVAESVARGRTSAEVWQVDEGGPGEAWASSLGFRVGWRTVLQQLDVTDARTDVPVPAGYRFRRWIGAAPDDLVESYARARNAIGDSPLGDAEFEHPEWTVERVREEEAARRRQDVEQLVVVAVHEESGEVAGLTEVETRPTAPTWLMQRDTAVVAAHRGRGLGVAMKAGLLRWVLPERPEVQSVLTGTGSDNVAMQRVNHALGYRDVRTWLFLQREVEGL
ncbi:GNAT family N-acetyltransferase [Saccharothrix variisporea]|uniref:Acetyltransferase (GNAT) family protein n=1 Tax=Saccharothrix variisporea TaxID=543527 RepID=A0A495XBC9_9PSEU|nr:GNAT family N-acetyltransferase [Saccharothrix variisporea]RKT70415.1 acetyltransferase (GNAT) family protein [Saccharothrix variisporea]